MNLTSVVRNLYRQLSCFWYDMPYYCYYFPKKNHEQARKMTFASFDYSSLSLLRGINMLPIANLTFMSLLCICRLLVYINT